MKLHKAIKILKNHQEWRLGKGEDMVYKPSEVTDAIDVILSKVKSLSKRDHASRIVDRLTSRPHVTDEDGHHDYILDQEQMITIVENYLNKLNISSC